MEVALVAGARRPARGPLRANPCASRSTAHVEMSWRESVVFETIWLPPRDSNPDNLLQRQVS
jgi:hypothetical protein